MKTTTSIPGSRLKEIICDKELLEQRQQILQRKIRNYVDNCDDPYRHPCAALAGELLGSNAHLAGDQIEEMRGSFTDLLVFLTDPEIAVKFKSSRSCYGSEKFANHLRRVLVFLDRANNKLALAEMALYDMDVYQLDDRYLTGLENDFQNV